MPPLDKSLFAGARSLTPDEVIQLEVTNFTSDIDGELVQRGWAKPAACGSIGLHLAIDNNSVEGGRFIVRGQLVDGKQLVVEAGKVWHGADSKASLVLRFNDASVFTFSEGGLASDIIDGSQVEFGLVTFNETKQAVPILDNDMEEWGFKGFSLRMLCHISKRSSTREGVIIAYTIILYPMWKADLLDRYEAAQNAAWPGLKVAEGHFPMFPKSQTPWGCPIMPWLIMEVNTTEGGENPDSGMLRAAIAAVMNQQAMAESCRTGSSLITKWDRIQNNPGDLITKTPDVTWPTDVTVAKRTATGK